MLFPWGIPCEPSGQYGQISENFAILIWSAAPARQLPKVPGVKDIFRALAVRPGLWIEAVRSIWSMRPTLRRPRPASDGGTTGGLRGAYYQWRMYTAYGERTDYPQAGDLIEFLDWRRKQRA